MTYQLLGVKYVDFVTKENETIKGYKLFCCAAADHVTGLETSNFWVSPQLMDAALKEAGEMSYTALVPAEGNYDISVDFNRYGKVAQFHLAV
ncbi:MAG: hypothetical protein RSD23_09970 [Ruthenibacterium sp.]